MSFLWASDVKGLTLRKQKFGFLMKEELLSKTKKKLYYLRKGDWNSHTTKLYTYLGFIFIPSDKKRTGIETLINKPQAQQVQWKICGCIPGNNWYNS